MKISFFAGSVVGYWRNAAAIYARGLAHGLSLRGNEVRVVEERQNHQYAKTLRAIGSGPARHFYDSFRTFQHHTYEPRHGAPLLEWVTREVSLIDVAVAVDGLEPELCRWLANLTRDGLARAYLTFAPETLTDEMVAELELETFDLILAPSAPRAAIAWQPSALAVAGHDRNPEIAGSFNPPLADDADPIRAAEVFESALARASVVARI